MPLQYFWLLPLGLLIGAFGTLIGAGGGFILVPILLLMYPHENTELITGISLAVVFFNALSGSWAYSRMKRIDYKSGIIFSLATIPGPYKIPNLQLEFKAVYTNKVTAMVVRGAGRPQAVYVMEKVMDRIARELDMDPAEVRRRNLIQKDQYPYSVGILYRDNNPLEYDSGNYPACLEEALRMIGYEDFRKSQLVERKRGVRLGVGIAAYVEGRPIPFSSSAFTKVASVKRGGGSVKCCSGCSATSPAAAACGSRARPAAPPRSS